MSAVIKSAQGLGVTRPLGVVAVKPPPSPLEEERGRLVQRIAALESEIAQRDATITELRAEIPRALEKGLAEGRAIGFSEAQDRQSERLALLGISLGKAQADFKESLGALDRLAALLTRECLDVILGDPKHRAQSVRKIVTGQIAKIEKSSVVAIELSKADFPDDEALAEVARENGLAAAAFSANDGMKPGGCRIALKLGTLEVGLDRQWTSLAAVLNNIAEGA
ncbi:MAG TPA: hypothetical protein VG889_09590 [Rhizomicrobium sp.]|nr:hypothetical protein [Rhizomicrobium sp.]